MEAEDDAHALADVDVQRDERAEDNAELADVDVQRDERAERSPDHAERSPTSEGFYTPRAKRSVSPLRRSLSAVSLKSLARSGRFMETTYDKKMSPLFNFFYDILQLSSGRDKVVAFIQNFAKFASDAPLLCTPEGEMYWVWRGVESNLSDSRKVFRFLKWLREVYKVRRGVHRAKLGYQEGVASIGFTCGVMDVCGHACSFLYFLLDNILWATSVGLIRSKEKRMHLIGSFVREENYRHNSSLVHWLGGVRGIKTWKNYASFYRLMFALAANILLLYKSLRRRQSDSPGAEKRKRKFDLDDPKLFHSLEILGMLCNFVILNSKLGFRARSHLAMGLLGMLAAAQGVWRNWRKVLAKKCGSKHFTPSVLHTPEAPSSPRSPSPSPSPSPRPPSPGSSSDAGDGSEGDSPANSIAGDSPGEEPSLSVS